MECLFCKIVAGTIPCYKIYEDENVLAFLDIAPVNPGHTLVIPKKHHQNIEAIPQEELCRVIAAVKKIGLALKSRLSVEGYNIQVNNDPISGQIIPHLHFHIVPRKPGDNLTLWPQGKYGPNEAEKLAAQLLQDIK
jgi:histidine triad (HIT) family protein